MTPPFADDLPRPPRLSSSAFVARIEQHQPAAPPYTQLLAVPHRVGEAYSLRQFGTGIGALWALLSAKSLSLSLAVEPRSYENSE